MGELLDALNALDDRRPAVEPINPFDQAMQIFRSASQRVNEVIEVIQEPGMPVDRIRRWTRQEPVQALAAAFLIGVLSRAGDNGGFLHENICPSVCLAGPS